LKNEPNLLVFGFEPNPETVEFLKDTRTEKYHRMYGNVRIENPFLNKQLYIVPVALYDKGNTTMDFYTVAGDLGCSSLYKPSEDFFKNNPTYSVESVIKVPVFTLQDFFDILPLDQLDYIEYIKIDAQGADLNIVKGAGNTLKEKVVFVTLEADGYQYEDAHANNETEIVKYMKTIGFEQINHPHVVDPTFVNRKFLHIANSIYICQRT
jgi:FkbM family methyltransferase